MASRNVVITGGSRGIGLGLAREFLARGHNVVITSRSQATSDRVAEQLDQEFDGARAFGVACSVRNIEHVQALWDRALQAMGSIDIWINNAGISNPHLSFDQLPANEIVSVVDTNVIGLMFGVHVAIAGMKKQGHGHIYNFEGFGSDGMTSQGMAIYGATKRSVSYFTEAVSQELEMEESPVKVMAMSPGIVITDMILEQARELPEERWEMAKAIYNCLADKVETVTPFLAEKALENMDRGSSERIAWLTPEIANERFNSEEYASRDFFSEHGL